MSVLYRVYGNSYEGEWTIAVYGTENEAIAKARAEARSTNESFGGRIGHHVGIERLAPGEHSEVEGWQDWKTRIINDRFVAVCRGRGPDS